MYHHLPLVVSSTNTSQRDRHYTFDDIKTSSAELDTAAVSTKEWLDAVERAKEIVKYQPQARTFQPEDPLTSGMLSHVNTFEAQSDTGPSPTHRGVLQKQGPSGDNDSLKGRKRFSKRQSKSGLTAVF